MAFENEKNDVTKKPYHNQLLLLLWKNFSLQKRSIIGTILELTIPAIFAIILLPIRTIVNSEQRTNDTTFNAFEINEFGESVIGRNYSAFAYHPSDSIRVNNLMKNVENRLNLTSTCKEKIIFKQKKT